MNPNPFEGVEVPPEAVLIAENDHTFSPLPMAIELPSGIVSLPCENFVVSQCHAGEANVFVLLQLAREGRMLHETLTPEGARLLGNAVLRLADEAEVAMLVGSNALLAEALSKGGPV